jgi:hypothetical protein
VKTYDAPKKINETNLKTIVTKPPVSRPMKNNVINQPMANSNVRTTLFGVVRCFMVKGRRSIKASGLTQLSHRNQNAPPATPEQPAPRPVGCSFC